MKKFFRPLWVFISLEVFFLVVLLFFTLLGTAETNMAADTANFSSTFWGMGWIRSTGVVRWLTLIFFQLAIFFVTGVTFVKSRNE